ncbi:MAG: hypothetical protein AAGJ79_11690 [Verrucomicrobiota bacterium]
MTSYIRSVSLFALTALLLSPSAYATTLILVDGEGFESPSYSSAFSGTGQLEGQFASTFGGLGSTAWARVGTGGTANVQSSVVFSGSQALEVNRDANADERWAVPLAGVPTLPFVVIDWAMRVESSSLSGGSGFGPFFGIEAYGNTGGIIRHGSLGVDANTQELLFTNAAFGLVPTAGGETVNFGEWNNFRLVFDFPNNEYRGFLNGSLLFVTAFEFGPSSSFIDADIAAIGASGDANSQAATGTAYFDNYSVFETDDASVLIPEPTAALTLLVGAVTLAMGRRRKNCR